MELEPTIRIIDDHDATREALTALFSSVRLRAQCYANAEEFLHRWEPGLPGCIVLDVRLPGMGGLQLQTRLNDTAYCPPIIFLSAYGDIGTAVRAMRKGAMNFLTKPVSGESLLEQVHEAVDLDLKRRRELTRKAAIQARLELLTLRERQVLEGLMDGGSNKQIARDLGISHKTVEQHRSRIMSKLHAQSVVQLAQIHHAGRIAGIS